MRTILVVEDSTMSREIVMRILRREGYNVVGATNGLEALDIVHQSQPDLVLLDIMMPEMDGLTLLEILRRSPETKEMPVILMTALSDEGRITRAKELGAQEYLVKTRFSYDDLVGHVGRHVQH